MKVNNISTAFEDAFLSVPLDQQINNCNHYELADYFIQQLSSHQPILEAGSGSGRWVGWFIEQGMDATGVDWSEELCKVAEQLIPNGTFVASDIADMPFPDKSFSSIVALGSIEHTKTGPSKILWEFNRLLTDDGIVIITVPYLSPIRRFRRFIRSCAGRRDEIKVKAPIPYSGKWAADYHYEDESLSFFQYVFSKKQMRKFLLDAGFIIEDEFVDFKDEGILHNFGHTVGSYDHYTGNVSFSQIGKLLRKLLPVWLSGHMLCYKVKKKL